MTLGIFLWFNQMLRLEGKNAGHRTGAPNQCTGLKHLQLQHTLALLRCLGIELYDAQRYGVRTSAKRQKVVCRFDEILDGVRS